MKVIEFNKKIELINKKVAFSNKSLPTDKGLVYGVY